MVKMLMACASGISSNKFAQLLNEAATARGIDATVEGCAIDTVSSKVGSFDVLIVGPIASHVASNLKDIIKDSASIVELGLADFNVLNVENILNKGLAAIK